MDNKLELLLKIASEYWNVPESQITTRSRKREVVEKRQILHYISSNEKIANMHQIGLFFGGHDHVTVMHSRKTISNLMYDFDIKTDVVEITRRFNCTL